MTRDFCRTLAALLLGAALTAGPAHAQSDEAPEEGATEAPADGAGATEAAEGEGEGAPAPMAEISAATVLATVDGREITLGELISLRANLPDEYQALPDEVLYEGLLNQLIDQSILEAEGREEGIGDRLDVALSLVNQIRAVLAEAYIIEAVDAELTDERLMAEYEARFAEVEPVEEVRARHILVATEEQASELKSMLDEGADFAELAMEHGTDGTAPRGGDLGFFVHADMVPEFADAAFAMEAGTISEPVQSPFGWHLIKLEERRDREAPPFEAVRPMLEDELGRAISLEIMERLRGDAEIVMPEETMPAAAIRADGLIAAE